MTSPRWSHVARVCVCGTPEPTGVCSTGTDRQRALMLSVSGDRRIKIKANIGCIDQIRMGVWTSEESERERGRE